MNDHRSDPSRTHLRSLLLGSDPDCDRVLDGPAVAPHHARLALDEDDHGWLESLAPDNELWLGRGDGWVRAERITLCAGDRIRIGAAEPTLEWLCAPFGARLALRPAPLPRDTLPAKLGERPDRMANPVRNPVTGLIEDRRR
jgi:hypothetical protein